MNWGGVEMRAGNQVRPCGKITPPNNHILCPTGWAALHVLPLSLLLL